jgi:hypothetical protein
MDAIRHGPKYLVPALVTFFGRHCVALVILIVAGGAAGRLLRHVATVATVSVIGVLTFTLFGVVMATVIEVATALIALTRPVPHKGASATIVLAAMHIVKLFVTRAGLLRVGRYQATSGLMTVERLVTINALIIAITENIDMVRLLILV